MKAKLSKIEENGMTASLTFEVALRDVPELPEGDLNLTVKKWRSPRSREALNYSWQIITDMAQALQIPKDELYKILVNDYGELERDGNGQLMKVVLKASVDPLDLDIYLHRTEHTTEIEGTLYRLYWVVKPPHEYNTQEFARFIDHIREEAKGAGIEVDSPG